MNRRTSLAWVACVGLSLAIAEATEARQPMVGFGLHLQSSNGYGLQTFYHQGTRWVLGQYGQAYQVRLTNPTPYRVEAVVTVDGRDVISGRLGSLRERGYVMPPYGTVTIRGFRQSLSSVAEFRFTRPAESYSARMGSAENVGVIGVAFFREAARPKPRPPRQPVPRRRSGTPDAHGSGNEKRESAKASGSQGSVDNLGTEYGASQYSPVSEVQFRRANPSRPDEILSLRYDDRDGLIHRGVIAEYPRWPSATTKDPFPDDRFAPPPPP